MLQMKTLDIAQLQRGIHRGQARSYSIAYLCRSWLARDRSRSGRKTHQ